MADLGLTRIHGWDLALNHSGFAEVNVAGQVQWFLATGMVKDRLKRWGVERTRLAPKWEKIKDPEQRQMMRLHWLADLFEEILEERQPDIVAIEDYAFGSGGNKGYPTAEMGGAARLACWRRGIPMRWHDPLTLKMYVTHSGAAKTPVVIRMVNNRWPDPFRGRGGRVIPLTSEEDVKGNLKLASEADGDLAVAYALAQLALTEWLLRKGKTRLDRLHPKEIQAFNRCTKARPINLLGREWIQCSAKEG